MTIAHAAPDVHAGGAGAGHAHALVAADRQHGERRFYTGTTVSFSFAVTNSGGSALPVAVIAVPLRPPDGSNADLTCPGSQGRTLAAGETFTCSVSGSFAQVGDYTYWADYATGSWPGVRWHEGSLTPHRTFTLAAHP